MESGNKRGEDEREQLRKESQVGSCFPDSSFTAVLSRPTTRGQRTLKAS